MIEAAGPVLGIPPPLAASPIPGPSTNPIKPKPNTPSIPGTLNGPPSGNNHAIPLSARRAEAMDLSTVERRGGPLQAVERSQAQRLFGLPEAPTFRPTEEEFREPMEYIRKIAADGAKYGIVKIIPPNSWNPPFAINTEVSIYAEPTANDSLCYVSFTNSHLCSASTFAHDAKN
jgi:[histone H3]-trimethyl-L-lysine4 demethylase